MVMTAAVVVRHRMVHLLVTDRVVEGTDFQLHARAGNRAQHGGGHRTPDGEQYGQHKQQPDAKGFHDGELLREELARQVRTKDCKS